MPFALLAVIVAAGPLKIASPGWNVVDIKPELASFYAEQMAQALRAEGFTVTTADDIATLLGAERQKELLGCSTTTSSCMAELANALGCDATLTVSLARLGGGFRGTAKLMSSKDASILSSVKIEATSEAQLADRVEAAAKELVQPFRTGASATQEQPLRVEKPAVKKIAPKLWWLPGAIGLAPAVLGGALLGVAAGTWSELTTKQASSADGEGLVFRGEASQTAGWIFVGIGAAAITSSILWLALGSTEVQPQVAITPSGGSLGVGGRF